MQAKHIHNISSYMHTILLYKIFCSLGLLVIVGRNAYFQMYVFDSIVSSIMYSS